MPVSAILSTRQIRAHRFRAGDGCAGKGERALDSLRMVNRRRMLMQVLTGTSAARAGHRAQGKRNRVAEAAERGSDTGCKCGPRRCDPRSAHVTREAIDGSKAAPTARFWGNIAVS